MLGFDVSERTISRPALSNSVLPGTSNGGPHTAGCGVHLEILHLLSVGFRFFTTSTGDRHRGDRSGDFQSVLRVVIEEEEPGNGLIGKCFA